MQVAWSKNLAINQKSRDLKTVLTVLNNLSESLQKSRKKVKVMEHDIIGFVASRIGSYVGEGLNHEGEKFTGSMNIESLLGGKGVLLSFKATGEQGVVFHEEKSMIAPAVEGDVGLFNLNTNTSGLIIHSLKSLDRRETSFIELVFAYGERKAKETFREEIKLQLHENGDIYYGYAWGIPNGDFADRSAVMMQKKDLIDSPLMS